MIIHSHPLLSITKQYQPLLWNINHHQPAIRQPPTIAIAAMTHQPPNNMSIFPLLTIVCDYHQSSLIITSHYLPLLIIDWLKTIIKLVHPLQYSWYIWYSWYIPYNNHHPPCALPRQRLAPSPGGRHAEPAQQHHAAVAQRNAGRARGPAVSVAQRPCLGPIGDSRGFTGGLTGGIFEWIKRDE